MALQQGSSATPHAASDIPIDEKVEFELLRYLYHGTPVPVMGGSLFVMAASGFLVPAAGATTTWSWIAVKFLVMAWRLFDCWDFAHADNPREELVYWRRRYSTSVLADGCVWGSMGWLFLAHAEPLMHGVVVAILATVSTLGAFTLVSHLSIAVPFSLCLILPTALVHLLRGDPASLLIAGGEMVLALVLAFELRRGNASLVEVQRLRFENAAIADQRQQALQEARQSNAAKSRFLATVSHALRTPLNGILGMTQLLEQDPQLPLAPRQSERLRVVTHSARHLMRVIGDLLELSRIQFDRLALDPQPTRLPRLVHDVAGLMGHVAAEKGLGLTVQIDAQLPAWAQCDGDRVRQVLHNLLDNAIKYTERGQVHLEVSRDGWLIRFVVQDTGPGVPAAQRERIFEPFEQGDRGQRSVEAGTGLGLSIARHLARAMGGEVICQEPASGRGATFVFTMAYLPSAERPMPDSGPVPLDEPPAFIGRILVAEDNAVNAMVATAMLDRLGARWALATDGAQALDMLQQEPFDLVLMDCQMPVLDGWEATRRWRALEGAHAGAARRRLPIVAVTANAVVGDAQACLDAGMDAYLAKPFKLDDLLALLRRYLPAATDNPPPCVSTGADGPISPPQGQAPRRTAAP